MVQSYKQKHEVSDHYDAILIGSGMGCQAAAACLAKEGQKVLMLPQIHRPGISLHKILRYEEKDPESIAAHYEIPDKIDLSFNIITRYCCSYSELNRLSCWEYFRVYGKLRWRQV